MADRLGLGMIGCGQISARFFNQAAQLDERGWEVAFVATCAAHEASARAKAEERGCARWYTDYRRLLEDPEVDGVVITTPHALHAGMATDAVRAGKHVLVEKPMATRWEAALALADAVRARDVTPGSRRSCRSPARRGRTGTTARRRRAGPCWTRWCTRWRGLRR
jgi:predicted dehydrogenase